MRKRLDACLRWAIGLATLAASLAMAGQAAAAPPAQDAPPTPAATPAPPCSECHLDVAHEWEQSPHSRAYTSEAFQAGWLAADQSAECLACHTTGATPGDEGLVEGSVHCESCHTEPSAPHPPASLAAKVAEASERCGVCHTPTLSEWRLSGHAASGVGCVECHNPHSQSPRLQTPDELCADCHKEGIAPHRDNPHTAKGVGCMDCHALTLPPENAPADGLAATGHSLEIGAATCTACHSDSVRAGRALPGYENGPVIDDEVALTATPEVITTPTPAASGAGRVTETQSSPPEGMDYTGLLLLAGLSVGGAGLWLVMILRRPRGDATAEAPVDATLAEAPAE